MSPKYILWQTVKTQMAFHQCLHSLLRMINRNFRERNANYFEIITCDQSIYTMDHPKLIVSKQKEENPFIAVGNMSGN